MWGYISQQGKYPTCRSKNKRIFTRRVKRYTRQDCIVVCGSKAPHGNAEEWTKATLSGDMQPSVYLVSYASKSRRLTALDVLRQGRKRIFLLNEEAFGYLEKVVLSNAACEVLPKWRSEKVWEEAAFLKRLDQALPNLNIQHCTAILGAAAVVAYHAENGVPIVDTLVCDEAAVFHWLTRAIMLC